MNSKSNIINIAFVITIFLFSCSSSGKFGVTQRYYLEQGETERALDKFIVEKYANLINVDTLNVPLNKFINSKNYKVYIGVSLNAKANKLHSFYKNDTLFRFIESRIAKDSISMFFKKKNEFYYSLIYNSQKDNYTYILTLESDSTTINNKFNTNFLYKKITNVQ